MRYKYTQRALDELEHTLATIAADDPGAASRVALQIEQIVELLAEMPLIGRRDTRRSDHVRKFAERPFPYLIVYRGERAAQ